MHNAVVRVPQGVEKGSSHCRTDTESNSQGNNTLWRTLTLIGKALQKSKLLLSLSSENKGFRHRVDRHSAGHLLAIQVQHNWAWKEKEKNKEETMIHGTRGFVVQTSAWGTRCRPSSWGWACHSGSTQSILGNKRKEKMNACCQRVCGSNISLRDTLLALFLGLGIPFRFNSINPRQQERRKNECMLSEGLWFKHQLEGHAFGLLLGVGHAMQVQLNRS